MELGHDNMNQLPSKFKIYESADSAFSAEVQNAVYYPPKFMCG
jgi:hypothetical protein